jgi:hypothetical protein
VTKAVGGHRLAEFLIRRACRRLPADVGAERYQEWAAELPAILNDPDIRFAPRRAARALRYAAGIRANTRVLLREQGQVGRARLPGAVLLATAAVVIWVAAVQVSDAHPLNGSWSYLYVAAGAVSETLAILAVVRAIRWMRRWFTNVIRRTGN